MHMDSRWFEYLQYLRRLELQLVLRHMKLGQTVLEIGAGAGWQALQMAKHGLRVVAIDINGSEYVEERLWPVIVYDGKHIPLADNSVDIVFSSNVLEHIPEVEAFQPEILRVLKPEGYAIHVLPTPVWRFWTSVAMYFYLPKRIYHKVRKILTARHSQRPDIQHLPSQSAIPRHRSIFQRYFVDVLWPSRHGEIGNSLTELYYFSRWRWTHLFQATGWQVESIVPTGLFYTGYQLFGPLISISFRRLLSHILGSICLIYILRGDNNKHVL